MCRQSQNIWWWVFIHRQPIEFFRYGLYGGGYFWHDSFIRHINRLIGCRLLGHRNVSYLKHGSCQDPDEPTWYCFDCHRPIKYEDTKEPRNLNPWRWMNQYFRR